jgi:hypothetical protein
MILLAQVESVAKSIPEIIKQASQSQLGILALLIIVLFGLAFYFFRGAPVRWRAVIFFVFFSGVVVYAWEINRIAGRPVSVHYVGRVLDKLTSAPLPESKVIVTLRNNSEPPRQTDSDGQFSFWISRSDPTQDATLRIDHEKYEPYQRIVPSDISNQLGDINLKLIAQNETVSQPAAATGSSGLAGAPTSRSAVTGSSATMNHRQSSKPKPASSTSRSDSPKPPKALAPPERRPPAYMTDAPMITEDPTKIAEASSGPKLSGSGNDWSEWYQVRIGAAPPGYSIEKIEFWLSGDRTCGAWAECKELTKDETQVIWEFRLQGHDEWGAPPQASSEGHLRVSYKLK